MLSDMLTTRQSSLGCPRGKCPLGERPNLTRYKYKICSVVRHYYHSDHATGNVVHIMTLQPVLRAHF